MKASWRNFGLFFTIGALAAPDLGRAGGAADLREAFRAAGIRTPSRPSKASDAMVTLGKALFYDKILSGNRNISCGTCHHPTHHTGDALALGIGQGGIGLGPIRMLAFGSIIPRNSPGVFNLGVREAHTLFWDGRVRRDPATGEMQTPEPALNGPSPSRPDLASPLDTALAAQAMFPVTSADEMRGAPGSNEIADAPTNEMVWDRLTERLTAIAEYRKLFHDAFPSVTASDLRFSHAARAMAAFETAAWTALSTPLDAFLLGKDSALGAGARAGAELFVGRGRCTTCHSGPLMSDLAFHSLAAPQLGPGKAGGDDTGRALISGIATDAYRFRTPPLRNVCLTGPWLHSGAYSKIESVVRHHADPASALAAYDASEVDRQDVMETLDRDPARNEARAASVEVAHTPPGGLTSDEIRAIASFLCDALTDPVSVQGTYLARPPPSVPSGLPVPD